MKELVIIGAGGHGLVVAEAALLMQQWSKVYFMDSKYLEPAIINNIPVITEQDFASRKINNTEVFIAIGDNTRRLELITEYSDRGYKIAVIIHPKACVSNSAVLGYGTVVMANAVINAQAVIHIGCIINTAAVIEHQCYLHAGVHVSPTACLAGNVHVGTKTWIGAGAVVINNKNLGSEVIVGAGAVVVHNIDNTQRVLGIPARAQLQEAKI